jgi:hypothetical protein
MDAARAQFAAHRMAFATLVKVLETKYSGIGTKVGELLETMAKEMGETTDDGEEEGIIEELRAIVMLLKAEKQVFARH